MRRIGQWLMLLAMAAASLSCGPKTSPPGPGRKAPTEAPLPAEATRPLAELTPPVKARPDAPDAEKLPPRAVDIVRRAEAMMAKDQHVQATDLLTRAKGFAPKSARVHRDLGLAYAALGNRAKAEPALRFSLKDAPNRVGIRLLLATYAMMAGRDAEAILELRKALTCADAAAGNADTGETLLHLGRLLEQEGYWTASLECTRRLSALISEHGSAYAKRLRLRAFVTSPEICMVAEGRVLVKLRRTAEAAKVLERAYRGDKANHEAGRLVIRAMLAERQFDRAEGILLEMLQEPAQRGQAVLSAAELCRVRKDPKTPRRLLTTYLDKGGSDVGFILAMAEVAADLGATDEAKAILTDYLAKAPADGQAARRLASLHLRTGNLPAAAEQLAAVLAMDVDGAFPAGRDVRRLARQGIDKAFIDDLAARAAQADGPKRASLLCVAGMLADAIGQAQPARDLLNRSIQADAKFAAAYETLLGLLADAGDHAAIDRLLKAQRAADPDGHFGAYLAGKVLLLSGRATEAVGQFEQARLRRTTHVPTRVGLGAAYARLGQFRNAEQQLRAAARLAPENVDVVGELFALYMRRRQPARARQVLAQFLRRNPQSMPARVMMGRYYLLRNQADQARKHVQALRAEAPDDVEVRLLELALDLPDRLGAEPIAPARAKDALGKIDAILRLDARNRQAKRLRAALLGNQGKHAEAAEAWESLHRAHPHDIGLATAYLDALIKADKQGQAVAAIKAIAAGPHVGASMRLALIQRLTDLKQYDVAEGFLTRWLAEYADSATPRHAELTMFRLRALKVYAEAKHYDKAQALLDEWIASGARGVSLAALRREKLRTYGLSGRHDDAIAYARKWLRNDPTASEPRSILVALLVDAKQYAKAHGVLDEWMRDATGDVLTLLRASKLDLYAREERFDEVVKFGRKWIAAKPTATLPNAEVVAVLAQHKQYGEALKIAEAWLAALGKKATTAPAGKSGAYEAERAIVTLLLMAKKRNDALARARRYAQAAPKDPRVLRLLSMALRALDKEDEVIAVLEKVHALDPDDVSVNNDLGYTWADRGVNLAKAEYMIRKALASRPDEIAFKDSLAWVLYKQARFAEAKALFDQILSAEESKQHPIILDHAGDACWRLGQGEQAIRCWERAVAMAKKQQAEDKDVDPDCREVLAATPKKIQAARKRGAPKVAPLGKGVSAPKKP